MTDTSRVPVLPFDGFLTLLRARGFAVGLHEHLALAGLLHRWPGTSSPEFGDAVAALVGRNEDEVASIRRLFDEHYAPPVVVRAVPEPPLDSWEGLRSRTWAIAAVLAALVLAVGVWWWVNSGPVIVVTNPRPDPVVTSPAPTITDVAPIEQPKPPLEPSLPDPPRRLDRRVATPVALGLFLLGLAGAWALKVRDERQRWLRRAWTTAADILPGPFHFPFVLRDPVARLPRIDIEDAATILGRALTNEAQARELDVRRSVQLTVRNGMLPSFVFRSRRLMPTILVVQDVGEDMRVWRDKVDLFLRDLRRQGVPLERYYFNADPRRVSDAPRGGTVHDLDRVLRRRPTAPLLVVSNGGGLAPLLSEPGGPARPARPGGPARPGRAGRPGGAGGAGGAGGEGAWIETLRARERKTWLTPVSDARLWPSEFDLLPLRVWPMTRRGLAQAARDLAGVDARPPERVLARILDEGRVSLDGIERMQRLASLVPYPTTELLELLRRRFAPDVPDAVIVHLLQQSGRPAAPVLRMTDDEIREFAAAVRFETPKLEAQVRHVLLDILRESEPQPGSAAHARWEIAVAAHRLALAELGEGSRADAAAVLESLSRGPLWEEARKVAALMPVATALHRVPGVGTTPVSVPATRADETAGDGALPAGLPPTTAPMPWVWPGLRELVLASAATLLLVSLAWFVGALPVRAVAHVADAYQITAQITASQGTTPNAPELVVDVGAAGARANGPVGLGATVPTRVDVYQDDTLYRSDVDISTGPASVRLASSDLGHYYRARATLADGNLAVSDALWVPDQATVVVIDAMPWARVTIDGYGGSGQPFTTPFTIALKPGSYRLRLENGDVTPSSDQTITVDATSRTYRFTMPGFDPATAANMLSGSPSLPTAR